MSEDRIVDSFPPFCRWDFHVVLDADWNDPLPQFLDADEEPLDLTGYIMQLYVRPSYGHETMLLFLTSVGTGAQIDFDDAAEGLATIYVDKDDLQTAFSGSGGETITGRFQFFLRITTVSADTVELARGNFYVHPGNE